MSFRNDNRQSSTQWGPVAWNAFHKKAVNYADQPKVNDVKDAVNFYQKVFPQYVKCDRCKNDYYQMIRTTPVRPYSKNDLFNWTVDIHNKVNNKINKPEMSYNQARQVWFNGNQPQNYNSNPNYMPSYIPQALLHQAPLHQAPLPFGFPYNQYYGGFNRYPIQMY